MKIRPKLPYFLFLFIISIVGCAVLKIDVDVYKGPLNNSEDMQGKQLVAMVAGTKDLLVQLRNNLELESLEKNKEILQDNEYEKRKELITNLKGWINVNIVGSATVSGIGYTTDKNGHLVKSAPMQYISRTMQGTTTVITYTLYGTETVFDTSYDIFTSKLASNVNDVLEFFEKETIKKKKNNSEFIKYLETGEIGADATKLRDELLSFAENVLMLVKYRTAMENINFIKDSLKVNSYVTVLQAIGNSIISQLNELQYQKSYKDKIEKESAKNNELWAMKMATTQEPKEVLDGIIKELKERQKKSVEKKKEYKEKIDKEISLLKGVYGDTEFSEIGKHYDNFENEHSHFCGSVTAYVKKKKDAYYRAVAEKEQYKTSEEIFGESEFCEALKELGKEFNDNATESSVVKKIIEETLFKEIKNPQNNRPRSEKLITTKSILEKLQSKFDTTDNKKFEEILKVIPKVIEQAFAEKQKAVFDEDNKLKYATNISKFASDYEKEDKLQEKSKNAEPIIKDNMGKVLAEFNLAEERPTREAVIWQLILIIDGQKPTTLQTPTETASVGKPVKKKTSGNGQGTTDASEVNSVETPTIKEPVETPGTEETSGSGQGKTDTSKTKQTADAIEILKEYNISMAVKVADDNGAKDTKDVFDQMVALLRHQHIQAVRNYGANSRQANDIDEALQLAYSYRSNMVYIRPPSAYLRNSYPSTSLQSNPGLAWKNMLGEHAWRSTPFIDNVLDLTGNKSQRGLAIADIDKQYWQNINSVRVAGAGRTNYVVAKDDIGNWYVKRYSSDPDDIIQSAKKLALFNLGAAGMMNVDLVNRLNSKIDQEKVQQSQQDQYGVQDGESKAPEVTGEKSEANRTTLEHIFDKYEGQYTEKTNIDYDNLRTILGTSSTQTSSTLETKIVDVWGKDEDTKKVIEKLKSKLTSAAEINLRSASKELPENLDEEEKDKKPKDKKTRAERIISALREIKQFHSRLISGIHDLELTNEPSQKLGEAQKDKETKEKEETIAKNEKTTAQDEYDKVKNDAEKEPEAKRTRDTAVGAHTMAQAALGTATSNFKTASDDLESAENAEKFAIKSATYIVRDVLMKVVEERIDVVGNYETGIIFIGDAIKPNKKE